MDSCHIEMRPCKNSMVLPEHFLDTLSLFECQEGTNMSEVSVFL